MNRERAVVADAELRAEATARVLADHADLVLRQTEYARCIVADAERVLRRGAQRELLVAPICDQAVRFHRRVSLHLRAVLTLQDVVGLREALLQVASRTACETAAGGSAQIALLRQPRSRAATACCRRLLGRAREDNR